MENMARTAAVVIVSRFIAVITYRIKGAPFIRGQKYFCPASFLFDVRPLFSNSFFGGVWYFVNLRFLPKKSKKLAKNKDYMKLLAVKNTFTELA